MKIYRETALRKPEDKAIIAMLDLWHSLSEQKIGASIEVMVGNRKEHQNLKTFSGELYTAMPQIIEGKAALVLWVNDIKKPVEEIIITHEIGHCILKLQGFKAFQRKHQKHSNIEIMLNSMAHHPPLYELQRSIGHDPQVEIDLRCIHNIKLFSKGKKEAHQKEVRIQNTLMLADDYFNSEENRYPLINVISKRHPNTSKLLKKLIELKSSYNLLVPDQNMIFCEQIIEELELGDDWYNPDEVEGLVSMVKQAATDKSQQSKP